MEEIQVLILMRELLDGKLTDMLRQVSPRLVVEARKISALGDLTDLWRKTEVLFTADPLPPEGGAPNLRWIQGYYAGIDRWGDIPTTQPYIWTTTSGIHVQVAELVFTFMLAFARKLTLMLDYQQNVRWPEDRFKVFTPYELRDSTVGIIGYGTIGSQVGYICRAFGMRVLAADREEVFSSKPLWRLPESGTTVPDETFDPSDIASLMKESDYVVLCVPYAPQTHGMISAEVLAAMKPNAVLINVARGNVVDEAALIDALKSGRIRGAGLDVFSEEPLPSSSPLWKLPNVLMAPHVAGLSPHYVRRAMTCFAENLRRYVSGEPLLNVVRKERGY